ncbi:hypothetical protein [Sporosarcina psychrophila]|uniref:SMODS and SLOG-associating 2TM effector domain-containing protein n=1 Tax=Sporosarcina psychrophila TaxID=1476 RepID=A0ABV2KBZ6_SPOPS
MGFWMSTLSSAIGSFVSVLGALIIAKWQINKTYRMNNIPFYLKYNEAQMHINNFIWKVDYILKNTEGVERKDARKNLAEYDFLELKESIELTIKTLNDEFEEVDFGNFSEELIKINKYAPLRHYKDLNFLIFSMAVIYNALRLDCKYLVNDMPQTINLGMVRNYPARFTAKRFNKRYKKLKKELRIPE